MDKDHSGEKIVSDVAKAAAGDRNFSGVAKELGDFYKQHPLAWRDELNRVNEAFHKSGFPGLTITGVHGQDFVGMNGKDKPAAYLDSQNLNHSHELAPHAEQLGKGHADLTPDGAGKYTVQHGDNPSLLAKRNLEHAFGDDFTKMDKHKQNTMIANYEKQMEDLNGGKFKMHVGDQVNLPSIVKQGAGSDFQGVRNAEKSIHIAAVDDKISDAAATQAKKLTEQNQMVNDGLQAWKKVNMNDHRFELPLDAKSLERGLQNFAMSGPDREALEKLQSNWGSVRDLVDEKGILGPNVGTKSPSSFFDTAMNQRTQRIDQDLAVSAKHAEEAQQIRRASGLAIARD